MSLRQRGELRAKTNDFLTGRRLRSAALEIAPRQTARQGALTVSKARGYTVHRPAGGTPVLPGGPAAAPGAGQAAVQCRGDQRLSRAGGRPAHGGAADAGGGAGVWLGAGAGLIRGDLRDVRGSGVACRSGGAVVVVRGAHPRTVPVLARYHERLLAAAQSAGIGLICGGSDPGRRNITTPLPRSPAAAQACPSAWPVPVWHPEGRHGDPPRWSRSIPRQPRWCPGPSPFARDYEIKSPPSSGSCGQERNRRPPDCDDITMTKITAVTAARVEAGGPESAAPLAPGASLQPGAVLSAIVSGRGRIWRTPCPTSHPRRRARAGTRGRAPPARAPKG